MDVLTVLGSGDQTLPRKQTEEQTWISVRLSVRLHEDLLRTARKDDRTASAMARRLLEEALRARGQLTEAGLGDEDDS